MESKKETCCLQKLLTVMSLCFVLELVHTSLGICVGETARMHPYMI